jgi:hypothetical protein
MACPLSVISLTLSRGDTLLVKSSTIKVVTLKEKTLNKFET